MNVEASTTASTTSLEDVLEGCLSGVLEGSDGGSNHGSTSLGELSSDKGDALDVLVAVLAGEAKLRGELRADSLTEKQGDGATAVLVEGDLKSTGDGVLAGIVETGDEDGETLLVSGRVLLAKDLDDSVVREPIGNRLWNKALVSVLTIHERVGRE